MVRATHGLVLRDQSCHFGRLVGFRGVAACVVDARGVVRVAHRRCLFPWWEP